MEKQNHMFSASQLMEEQRSSILSAFLIACLLTLIFVVSQKEFNGMKTFMVFSGFLFGSFLVLLFVEKQMTNVEKPRFFSNPNGSTDLRANLKFLNFKAEDSEAGETEREESPTELPQVYQQPSCGMEMNKPSTVSGCASTGEPETPIAPPVESDASISPDSFQKPYYIKPALDCLRTLRAGYNETVVPY